MWLYKICSFLLLIVLLIKIYQGIAPTIILVRVSMKLSFDDRESFKEVTECLRFIKTPSDTSTGFLGEISEDTYCKDW